MTEHFRYLWKKTGLILLVTSLLIVFCYFFVDRQCADFIHHYHIDHDIFLIYLTYLPEFLKNLIILLTVYFLLQLLWRGPGRSHSNFIALTIAVSFAYLFKDFLKNIFGRYWPNTWHANNPSWLVNHAYGFHPFHASTAYASFPSGHSIMIFTIATIIWMQYPRYRWLCVLASATVVFGLLGMNFHFVSDIIAGAVLGCLVSVWTLALCDANNRDRVI